MISKSERLQPQYLNWEPQAASAKIFELRTAREKNLAWLLMTGSYFELTSLRDTADKSLKKGPWTFTALKPFILPSHAVIRTLQWTQNHVTKNPSKRIFLRSSDHCMARLFFEWSRQELSATRVLRLKKENNR